MPLWTLFGLRKGKRDDALGRSAAKKMVRKACSECHGSSRSVARTGARNVPRSVRPTRSESTQIKPGRPGWRSTTAAASLASSVSRPVRPMRSRPPPTGRSEPATGPTSCCLVSSRSIPKVTEPESRHGFRRSLHIRHVDAGSCNGCESELQALNNPFYNLHRLGIFFTPSPRFADLLLVTGPVTYAMREPLQRAYEAMPEPRWVMAVGTCAVSGGVAGGGYACGNGLEGVLPVDLYLPGCPPNPAALIEALLMFLERAPQRVKGGRLVE